MLQSVDQINVSMCFISLLGSSSVKYKDTRVRKEITCVYVQYMSSHLSLSFSLPPEVVTGLMFSNDSSYLLTTSGDR